MIEFIGALNGYYNLNYFTLGIQHQPIFLEWFTQLKNFYRLILSEIVQNREKKALEIQFLRQICYK